MSQEVSPEVLEALQRLARSCHARCNHPDYEYDTTETGRKTSEEAHPPEGHGWEVNVDKGDEGWDRLEYTEEHYWRRLKTDAEKDPLLPHDLPSFNSTRVSRRAFASRVINLLTRLGINNSFHMVTSEELLTLPHGSHRYLLSGEPAPEQAALGLKSGLFYIGIDMGYVQIIQGWVPADHPEATFIRTVNKHGLWCAWQKWFDYGDCHIDLGKVYDEVLELNYKVK